MKKSEITKLVDKDLQLRYYLGGLKQSYFGGIFNDKTACNYWRCDINCSCSAVPDDERLLEVKRFISGHGFTNERFLKLSCAFLENDIMKYKGKYSPLFIELDGILKSYDFVHNPYSKIIDNDFREKELGSIIDESIVSEYCSKYQIDITDFISLAKTSINFNIPKIDVEKNDTFIDELYDIIRSYNFYVSREQIEQYGEEYKNNKENAQLLFDTKENQKKYLKLMKELLIKEPNLAIEMVSKELIELGFDSKKEVKKLLMSKKQK